MQPFLFFCSRKTQFSQCFLQALHIPRCEQLSCVTLRILEHDFVSGAISFLTVVKKFVLVAFILILALIIFLPCDSSHISTKDLFNDGADDHNQLS